VSFLQSSFTDLISLGELTPETVSPGIDSRILQHRDFWQAISGLKSRRTELESQQSRTHNPLPPIPSPVDQGPPLDLPPVLPQNFRPIPSSRPLPNTTGRALPFSPIPSPVPLSLPPPSSAPVPSTAFVSLSIPPSGPSQGKHLSSAFLKTTGTGSQRSSLSSVGKDLQSDNSQKIPKSVDELDQQVGAAVGGAIRNEKHQEAAGQWVSDQMANQETRKMVGKSIAESSDNQFVRSVANNEKAQEMIGSGIAGAATNKAVQNHLGNFAASTAEDPQARQRLYAASSGLFSGTF